MIIPDVNLLLYATVSGFDRHAAARRWLEGLMNGTEPVGLTAPAIFGFLRISTNPRVFSPPMSLAASLALVEGWLERPHVQLLLPGRRHLTIAFDLLRGSGSARDLTTDVQLAALAIEHGAELQTNDADFGRFPGVRRVNPLA